MSAHCTVIIGALERLSALRESITGGGELLSFGDNEPLQALEAITTRRPEVIALERLFAATSRGAALINRIKADRALDRVEIRVVRLTELIASRRAARRGYPRVQRHPAASATQPASQTLDFNGTRRATRFRMADGTEMQINGAVATIVDLSTYGAQILCSTPLKPQQLARIVLADDAGIIKCSASVA